MKTYAQLRLLSLFTNTASVLIVTTVKSALSGVFSALRPFPGLLYPYPSEFLHSSPEAPHTKQQERPLPAEEGTYTKEFS